jgi:hypothetical protein
MADDTPLRRSLASAAVVGGGILVTVGSTVPWTAFAGPDEPSFPFVFLVDLSGTSGAGGVATLVLGVTAICLGLVLLVRSSTPNALYALIPATGASAAGIAAYHISTFESRFTALSLELADDPDAFAATTGPWLVVRVASSRSSPRLLSSPGAA